MTRFDEDRLRDNLRQAVPDPESDITRRAAAARARARKARTRRTGIVVVLAIAAIGVIGIAGTGIINPLRTQPASTTAADQSISEIELTCPAWDSTMGSADEPLPEGAVAARLCAPPSEALSAWQAPSDLLVNGLDELIAAVNAQQLGDPASMACTADAGPAYILVFGYPDGTSRPVYGELFGCRWLRHGDTTRLGADTVWQQIATSWRAQRAPIKPPEAAPFEAPPCTEIPVIYGRRNTFSPLATLDEVVAASYCVGRIGIEGPFDWTGSKIPAELLRSVTESALRDISPQGGCEGRGDYAYALVGLTAWGDRFLIQTECPSAWPLETGAEAPQYWTPPQSVLDELTAFIKAPQPQ